MATQLFKEGRALFDAGRVGPACRKLEESERLDPGGGTLLNLALCHEREGLTATAWVEFTEALGIAKHDDRAPRIEFARSHIAQLEPELSRLTIQVSNAADVPDLEIRRDGAVLGRAARDSPIPVDPGDHVVEATAPGKSTWRQSVVLGGHGDAKTVIVPALEDAPGGTPAAATTPSPSPSTTTGGDDGARRSSAAPRVLPEKAAPEESGGRPVGATIAAWTSIGIGVAAAGVGTYFGVRAISLKNEADGECGNNACTAQGSSRTNDAMHAGDAATVSFSIAAVGVVVGTVLFLVTHPSGRPAAAAGAIHHYVGVDSLGPSLGPGERGFVLGGRF